VERSDEKVFSDHMGRKRGDVSLTWIGRMVQ
jgi:hypothetical protein